MYDTGKMITAPLSDTPKMVKSFDAKMFDDTRQMQKKTARNANVVDSPCCPFSELFVIFLFLEWFQVHLPESPAPHFST